MARLKKRLKSGYKLETRLRSALRLLWLRSPMRYSYIKQARIGRGIYECALCKEPHSIKDLAVDHITPLGKFTIETVGDWIYRLFYSEQRVLCKSCHYRVTHE